MEPKVEDILQVRNKVIAQLNARHYHEKDVERLQHDDDWVRRFLLHRCVANDTKKAVQMITNTLQWRKNYGVHDITEESVLEVLQAGFMFPHNTDKDGSVLFVVKAVPPTPGRVLHPRDVKRGLIYWFERIEKEEKGTTMLFDLAGAAVGNMDMDFVQFVIQVTRDYYPVFLKRIVIYEMPWILTAAWRLIKMWIPSNCADLIQVTKRSELSDFVDPENQLAEWGGEDYYTYHYRPACSAQVQKLT